MLMLDLSVNSPVYAAASRWGRRRLGSAAATWLGTTLWPVTRSMDSGKILTIEYNDNSA